MALADELREEMNRGTSYYEQQFWTLVIDRVYDALKDALKTLAVNRRTSAELVRTPNDGYDAVKCLYRLKLDDIRIGVFFPSFNFRIGDGPTFSDCRTYLNLEGYGRVEAYLDDRYDYMLRLLRNRLREERIGMFQKQTGIFKKVTHTYLTW